MSDEPPAEIRILHVDDDPDVLEMTAAFVERESAAFVVKGETSADAAMERLASEPFDCVVSDYEMPGTDGLEFLASVRERWPELPFVLFTGQGSEDVAGAAISAGVTDYMQKGVGTSQYEVLANRVGNAVENARTLARVERHRRAIETAREGIAILDADGRFTFVNRAYADLYGYDPAEMFGEHWSLIYPDEEVARVDEEILPTVERDGRWRGETTGLRADGTTFVEDHSLAVTEGGGFVCSVREIGAVGAGREGSVGSEGTGGTEPDREESADQTSRRRFWLEPAEIVERAADAVHVVDADGVIRYANPATCELTGYPREVLEGSPIGLITDEAERQDHREAVDELVESWPEPRSRELAWRLQTADGGEVLCDSTVSPVFVDGEPRGFVAVAREVEDRIEREDELRARTEEVERQNRQLETLASVVSHDLRNPLNVAMGRLDLVRTEGGEEHLADIGDALERVEAIVDDMLALVREWGSVEEPTVVDLRSYARSCWENVVTGDATLEVVDDVAFQADGRRLQNLLENLLGNAVAHGGTGVAVRVGRTDGGFYVEDDGGGIPREDRQQVFEAGYSTGEGGTGLGLHIVRAIADAHGWEVRATVGESGGARFEVTGVTVE